MTAPVAVEAGAAVFRSPKGPLFAIRPCVTVDELNACIQLQQQIWGYPDMEVVPRNIYVLAQALGGHVLAAWDEQGELAGFAMAMAAHEPAAQRLGAEETQAEAALAVATWMRPVSGTVPSVPRHLPTAAGPVAAQPAPPVPYLHSHMLAVVPRYQSCGLGSALKLAQRDEAVARGITRMRWTFDPLMAKNACFNLNRLGAMAVRYIPDFYGCLGSKLQGGLPTDRLLAEWHLESVGERNAVEQRMEHPERGLHSVVERVKLPAAVAAWKAQGAYAEAEAAQTVLRAQLQAAFGHGLQIEGFLLDSDGGGEYLLTECARPARRGGSGAAK